MAWELLIARGMMLPADRLQRWWAMTDSILVIEGDVEQCRALCDLIRQKGHSVAGLCSPEHMNQEASAGDYRVVIVDLDLVPLNNLQLRELKRNVPDACLMAISSRSFHPELKEAMREHIDVCLNKPVDPDELLYWLQCFEETEVSGDAPRNEN
jgi:DNA-binding NtrC family response regulator